MLNNSLYSSENDCWETPQFLFNQLNNEFGFTLDVCALAGNKKCNNYFDKQKDALRQEWTGVAWMNPPYGRGIDKWVSKAYFSSLKGCVVVCLLPVRSDTRWWHDYVMKSAEIRLLNKRLSFEGSNNKAPFPSAIVIFNTECNKPSLTSMKI